MRSLQQPRTFHSLSLCTNLVRKHTTLAKFDIAKHFRTSPLVSLIFAAHLAKEFRTKSNTEEQQLKQRRMMHRHQMFTAPNGDKRLLEGAVSAWIADSCQLQDASMIDAGIYTCNMLDFRPTTCWGTTKKLYPSCPAHNA